MAFLGSEFDKLDEITLMGYLLRKVGDRDEVVNT